MSVTIVTDSKKNVCFFVLHTTALIDNIKTHDIEHILRTIDGFSKKNTKKTHDLSENAPKLTLTSP